MFTSVVPGARPGTMPGTEWTRQLGGFLEHSGCGCARSYGGAENIFFFVYPALALQRALPPSGPCRATISLPAQAGLDRGASIQRLPLRRL
jgi:hypothetical protein